MKCNTREEGHRTREESGLNLLKDLHVFLRTDITVLTYIMDIHGLQYCESKSVFKERPLFSDMLFKFKMDSQITNSGDY